MGLGRHCRDAGSVLADAQKAAVGEVGIGVALGMLHRTEELQMTTPGSEPGHGAVNIPSADGYHYADDHPWNAYDQAALTDDLWDTVHHFRESHEEVPAFYEQSPYKG